MSERMAGGTMSEDGRRPTGDASGKDASPWESVADVSAEAGEAACYAYLVCPECGAVTTEGHLPDCSLAAVAADRRD